MSRGEPESAPMQAAHCLGVPQEAHRIGSQVLGTEHLLITAMADPGIRWAFARYSRTLRQVQAAVETVSAKRPDGSRGPTRLSGHAEAILSEVLRCVPKLAGGRAAAGPAGISEALAVLLSLLFDAPPDAAVTQAIAELGLSDQATSLINLVESRSGRSGPEHFIDRF